MEKLTRFERARILGARALQLALGAPVLIKTKGLDPMVIAREELEKGVVPISIIRTYPDGTTERVEAS